MRGMEEEAGKSRSVTNGPKRDFAGYRPTLGAISRPMTGRGGGDSLASVIYLVFCSSFWLLLSYSFGRAKIYIRIAKDS